PSATLFPYTTLFRSPPAVRVHVLEVAPDLRQDLVVLGTDVELVTKCLISTYGDRGRQVRRVRRRHRLRDQPAQPVTRLITGRQGRGQEVLVLERDPEERPLLDAPLVHVVEPDAPDAARRAVDDVGEVALVLAG